MCPMQRELRGNGQVNRGPVSATPSSAGGLLYGSAVLDPPSLPLMPTKSFLPGLILAFCAVVSLCSVAAERKAPSQSNSASTTLIETASRQYENGQLDQAAATLERALHIQPNNPATLHYLGVLRLQQGQYEQAETLAARSNMRVGRNVELRNRNFQLIQAAQQAKASSTSPNAKEDLVAVQEGLKEEVQKRREAEMAAVEQANAGKFASAQAQRVSDSPTAGGPGLEGELPVASVVPEPAYDEVEIPRGHWPPPGKCRIWFPDRPPGHQPKPGKCKKLRYRVPSGAYLVHG
ncbi:tetratricopeptide repeat protein [Pseudomonas sp. 478]|nr:tetratricopeptide repeat protein [Pseudomonas sp. 478]TCV56325.1 tetratricopeptide repeat protein [Pseudomonas sp. 460]